MKRSNILLLVAIAGIITLIIYSLQGGQPSENYTAEIEKERKDKDEFMKSDKGSPFQVDSLEFHGLNYFPIDPKFNIKAKLVHIEKKKVVILGTSDGKQQKYLEYAHAIFNMDGVENKLLILEVMDMGPQRGKLFLAFADATSSAETYGAGRYLDVKKVHAASSIQLDFNLAYNPYCAYTDSFTCPFPPKENVLAIAVRAGEMNYHK
jgi:uncharacterized protein (DUF1684 family)